VQEQLQREPDPPSSGDWLTGADLRALDGWYRRVARPRAMLVAISVQHEVAHEVVQIGLPDAGPFEPRWLVWRDAAGVWLDDMYQERTYGPISALVRALNRIEAILARELARAVAKLPERLIPSSTR
jgi:hypothetical protein